MRGRRRERDDGGECAWRGDRHKSLLLLDEHKVLPDDGDCEYISKWNEDERFKYLIITVSTTFCLLFCPKSCLIAGWSRISRIGQSNSKVIWHWKIDFYLCRPFRRIWMKEMVIIVVYTRVTSEFIRARKTFLARRISTNERFFACMSSYVSGLKDDKMMWQRVR